MGRARFRPLKVARKRRSRSPDLYYYSLQACLARFACQAYYYHYSFPKRGKSSVRVMVLLDGSSHINIAVEDILEVLFEFDDVLVCVTHCQRAFIVLCGSAAAADGNYHDICGDCDDDEDHDDDIDDDNGDDDDDDVDDDEDDDGDDEAFGASHGWQHLSPVSVS